MVHYLTGFQQIFGREKVILLKNVEGKSLWKWTAKFTYHLLCWEIYVAGQDEEITAMESWNVIWREWMWYRDNFKGNMARAENQGLSQDLSCLSYGQAVSGNLSSGQQRLSHLCVQRVIWTPRTVWTPKSLSQNLLMMTILGDNACNVTPTIQTKQLLA